MSSEVLSYGELLIDFSQHGLGPLGYPAYEALPGGGVANMVVALARWGHRTAFAGRVGADALGTLLRRTLEEEGVDTRELSSSSAPTTMAIVSLNSHGDRSFDFLWKGTSCDGIPVASPQKDQLPQILHFSSVSMCVPEGRKNNLATVRLHREAGCWISFDPNLRLNLWPDESTARAAIREGLALADVVKISEEEVAFVLGEVPSDPADQARRLFELYRPKVLFVTMGAHGCFWLCASVSGQRPAPRVAVVDTTGAGDCFMAGVLHKWLETGKSPGELTADDADSMAAFGVAAGSSSTTRRGGIPSLPPLETVEACLRS